MPNVDFYLFENASHDPNTWITVCRLIEKVYTRKHRTYIYTAHEADAKRLSHLLWTYRDTVFLPHTIGISRTHPVPLIHIGWEDISPMYHDILINLDSTIPNGHSNFLRILDCVFNDSSAKNGARERYRYYRAQGYAIQTHSLQTKKSDQS